MHAESHYGGHVEAEVEEDKERDGDVEIYHLFGFFVLHRLNNEPSFEHVLTTNTSMKQVERPMLGLKSETSGKKISKTIMVVVKARAVPVKILSIVK